MDTRLFKFLWIFLGLNSYTDNLGTYFISFVEQAREIDK